MAYKSSVNVECFSYICVGFDGHSAFRALWKMAIITYIDLHVSIVRCAYTCVIHKTDRSTSYSLYSAAELNHGVAQSLLQAMHTQSVTYTDIVLLRMHSINMPFYRANWGGSGEHG